MIYLGIFFTAMNAFYVFVMWNKMQINKSISHSALTLISAWTIST